MPRVVADTNIYISALNFGGRADDVLALARAGVIEIHISPAIINEIVGRLGPQVRLVRATGPRSDAGNQRIHCSRSSNGAGESRPGR